MAGSVISQPHISDPRTRSALPPVDLSDLGARLAAGDINPRRLERLLDFEVAINDPENYVILCKDIFCRRIYHFESAKEDPVILDCGANIGLSALYFKFVYPGACITAFEPDPSVLALLRQNLAGNGHRDVRIVEAALAANAGEAILACDGNYGSHLLEHGRTVADSQAITRPVRCVRLGDYLTQPVDFVKMNIEGAETEVLLSCGERIANIREMVVEYHHLPGLPRTLHLLLEHLHAFGFDYLIHDFDAQTSPGSKPPFRLGVASRYYLLIYARQRGPDW